MPAQYGRSLVAGLVAISVLLVAHWLDASVLGDAQIRAGRTYDSGPLMNLIGIAHIVTAGGVIAIALAGWRSRSLAVGAGYAVVGGFMVFLPALVWALSTSVNGAAPLAPEPIASTLDHWFFALQAGVTGAVYTLAGAMLLSGLAVVWSLMRGRRRGVTIPATTAAPRPEAGPLRT